MEQKTSACFTGFFPFFLLPGEDKAGNLALSPTLRLCSQEFNEEPTSPDTERLPLGSMGGCGELWMSSLKNHCLTQGGLEGPTVCTAAGGLH